MFLGFISVATVCLLVTEATPYNHEYHPNETIDVYDYFCKGYTASVFDYFIKCVSATNDVVVFPTFCLAGYPPPLNGTSLPLYAGKCPSIFISSDNNSLGWFFLPKTISTNLSTFNEEVMCKGINRTGVLCGKCDDLFRVSLNSLSFECISDEHCHDYNWLYFIMAHIVPVTVLFLLVVFYDIKLTSGYAYSYILISQIVSLHSIGRAMEVGLLYVTKASASKIIFWPILSFYSIWSLDMGHILAPNVCVNTPINTLDAIALQYLPAYYSLLLCVFVYCLSYCRKYKKLARVWNLFSCCFSLSKHRTNFSSLLVNVFAIFLLLSYSKLLEMSLMLLSPTYLYDITGSRYNAVYLYDGTVNYFQGTKVILLNIFAIFTLIVFIIIPPFLLLFYPMRQFRRVLQYLNLNRPGLVTFVNSFQECYKDGTNGTRDYRWFSAVYFLLRIITYSIFLPLQSLLYHYVQIMLVVQVLLILVLLMILFLSPYKQHYYNKLDISLFVLIIFIISLGIVNYVFETEIHPVGIEVLLMISFIIPFVCAVLYISYYTVLKLIVCTRLSYKAWYTMRQVHNTSDIDSFVQDKATVSHTFTTDRNDLTPSLPDRLVHPFSYSEDDNFISVNYGSTDQKR